MKFRPKAKEQRSEQARQPAVPKLTVGQPCEGARLDPEVAALFALATIRPPRLPSQIDAARKAHEATAKWSCVATPAAAEEWVCLPGPGGSLRARVFWPFRRRRPVVPVIVYFHGGGYALGSPDSLAHVTRALCRCSQSVVVSVDYRLAPEHPFPAAIEDGFAATRWVHEHAAELGADPDSLFVAGDSAGGNAAAAVALMLRDAGQPILAGIALLCPWLDMSLSSPSYRKYVSNDPVVDDASTRLLRDLYLRGESVMHPLVSPIHASLAGLPPTYLAVGEADPLRDDGTVFAERLRAAGVRAVLEVHAAMPHEFVCVPFVEAAGRALKGVASFVHEGAPEKVHPGSLQPRPVGEEESAS